MNEEIKFLKKLQKREVLRMVVESESVCMVDEYEDENNFDINNFIDEMYTFLRKHKKAQLIDLYFNEDKLKEIVSEVVKTHCL